MLQIGAQIEDFTYHFRTRRARSVFQSAGPVVAILQFKVDRTGMCILQEPSAVALLLGSDQIDRFVHTRVRHIPD